MKDYFITRVTESDDDMKHYGVIGMKWGVQRANKRYTTSSNSTDRGKAKAKLDKHMVKADKKLNKLDNKIAKKYSKAEKAYNKYAKFAGRSAFFRSKSKIKEKERKFKTADARYTNSINKANKWYKNMENVFKDTPVNLTSQQQALGEKYAEAMKARLEKTGFDR